MSFDHIALKTEDFSISISKITPTPRRKEQKYSFEYTIGKSKQHQEITLSEIRREVPFVRQANWSIAQLRPSIFFSTFRRLEGGFSISGAYFRDRTSKVPMHFDDEGRYDVPHTVDVGMALSQLSEMLSIAQHRFVASISTADIILLLTTKYAEISDMTNKLHSRLSEGIFSKIEGYGRTKKKAQALQLKEAKRVLDRISKDVAAVNEIRTDLLRPFDVLSNLIDEIYDQQGIQVTPTIVLGKAREGIDSDALSSGEKQMLSFLCYNAFSSSIPIFIDEPELSLHIDWQRLLFRILLSQQTGNQFIVATHSPAIYTKYTDKELPLTLDRE